MKRPRTIVFKLPALAILLGLAFAVSADQLRKSLFEDTEVILKAAKESNAQLLAPVSFSKAVSAYDKANKRYKKNQGVEKIKKDLVVADSLLKKAIETTKLANITFKSAIKARNDARGVEAASLSPDKWKKAEKQFNAAAESLETGSLASARKKSEMAENTYREAELMAIKSSYLSKTREYIAAAKRDKVDRYAPLTLENSEILLAKAEKELSENRYDTDYPRSLAKKSLYQAKHAIHLAKYIKKLRAEDVTTEALLLKMEEPLTKVASSLDMVAEFDKGFSHPTKQILQKVDTLLGESHDLKQLEVQMGKLEKDYAGLEKRLGIQSKRMAVQEEQRRKIKEINSLFTPQEAVVVSQGESIIIRAVGLSFDPGSSRVNTSNNRLLGKLQKVFTVFKKFDVIVEGHTDSFGGDSQNLVLSYDRAIALREYFVMNMPGFSAARSKAAGYGETRPIANNETPEGRRKNRRIDLVFMPKT